MIKRFYEWNELKKKLHEISLEKLPLFKEGEIWWCSVGYNIGNEINGKSIYFSRPVLVFRRFSKEGFFGLPLTSKMKIGTWFVQISFKSKIQTIILNQGRNFNARRLQTLMGQCDESDIKKIKTGFYRLYLIIPSHKRRSWEIPKLFSYVNKLIFFVKSKIFNQNQYVQK